MFPRLKIFYQSNDGGGGDPATSQSNDGNSNSNGNGAKPETFDQWLEAQSDETKLQVVPLYKSRMDALENTVKATRRERDDFSRQLREASKKAEAGSEQQKELARLAASLDESNRKAEFYEQAPEHECRNPRAAFAIAKAQELFTKSGEPDWKQIQAEAPELFGKVSNPPPRKSAGSGTGSPPAKAGGMNDWIRQQAGVQVREE